MLSMNKLTAALTALALVLALAALAMAAGPPLARSQTSGETPGLVSYQGYLTDTDGLPMEGPIDLSFGLYPTNSKRGRRHRSVKQKKKQREHADGDTTPLGHELQEVHLTSL